MRTLSLSTNSPIPQAVGDFVQGFAEWRIWWVLGLNDIQQRYRRSAVGQFWNTITIGAQVLGIALVFGVILKQSIPGYVLFLGTGFVVWNLIAGLINDLAMAFISSDVYLRSYPGARSVVVFRAILRNLIVAAHNVLIIPILWIIFGGTVSWATLLVVPGVLLLVLNAFWIGLWLGPLSARFRDVPQLVANFVQLAFFISPVLYRPEEVQKQLPLVTHYNPFASFLEVVRAPLLGQVPDLHHYLVVAVTTLVGFAIAIPLYGRFRGRVAYWL